MHKHSEPPVRPLLPCPLFKSTPQTSLLLAPSHNLCLFCALPPCSSLPVPPSLSDSLLYTQAKAQTGNYFHNCCGQAIDFPFFVWVSHVFVTQLMVVGSYDSLMFERGTPTTLCVIDNDSTHATMATDSRPA